ncbi:MAG: hypothetical protein PF541_16770 [Prolixibacteraceae bacterium]|jgi:putative effector of murein hydrolase|nr:hypothetical protein [Prolixibacteraceae bacterium]
MKSVTTSIQVLNTHIIKFAVPLYKIQYNICDKFKTATINQLIEEITSTKKRIVSNQFFEVP